MKPKFKQEKLYNLLKNSVSSFNGLWGLIVKNKINDSSLDQHQFNDLIITIRQQMMDNEKSMIKMLGEKIVNELKHLPMESKLMA